MPRQPDTLFDDFSLRGEEALLLDDLGRLVELGLIEERPSPDGPTYALTELGREAAV
jgi:DNA-binding HxlR family transcriptional regulator